jgi:hypothetical protein
MADHATTTADDDEEIEITAGPGPRRTAARPAAVGTDQQEDFWRVITDTADHCRLTARAGTGKSFSLREGIWRRLDVAPAERLQYAAFNRLIAAEFQADLPRGAVASTLHAAGFGACARGLRIEGVDKRKPWRHASAILPAGGWEGRIARSAMVKLASLAKNYGLIHKSTDLIPHDDLIRVAATHGIMIPPRYRNATLDGVTRLLGSCIDDTTCIDFDDMIFFPVLFGLPFDPIDMLLVDEAQDLSPLQHAMIRAMSDRIIFVGDDRQAIYAFRGADSASMDTLDAALSADPARDLYALPLTLTRRCPRSHVELARALVPDFGCLPEAPEGIVNDDASGRDIAPGWLVLCRTNAPLVEAAFGYASAGQKVAIAGGDIGDQLATLAKSFQAVDADDLRRKAEAFRAAELARLAEIDGSEDDASALADQCECIVTAAGWGGTIAEVIESIEDIFADPTKEDAKSYILLSSIHRAKGRESDRVAILAPESMPHKRAVTAEALTQEYNLAYVAATRSKDRLDFLGPIPDVYSPAYHAANAPEGGAA